MGEENWPAGIKDWVPRSEPFPVKIASDIRSLQTCNQDHDALTGLLNRNGFLKRLSRASDLSEGASLTLVILNIDGFKQINATLGLQRADKLLIEIAYLLAQVCGQEAVAARWSADEFIVLLPADTLLEGGALFAKRLTEEVGQERTLGHDVVSISFTCGVAQNFRPGAASELVERATLALTCGKETSRGSVHCWTEGLESVSSARHRAIFQVTQAFAKGCAYASYQPIVELETGTVVAVEALLRLRTDCGKELTGSDIFPAIADPMMSRRIFRFMIAQLAKDAHGIFARFGRNCQIGLNVSDADMRPVATDDDFVSLLTTLTKSSPLNPANIVLEITESMLLRDHKGTIRDGLRALDRLGYIIALDDFGTGYSSLTHLRDFPIRKVKIDKSFIARIGVNQQCRTIIQAIVQMSRSLGLEVVAEGVENANEEMFLRAVGCEFAQGYRYGKPERISC